MNISPFLTVEIEHKKKVRSKAKNAVSLAFIAAAMMFLLQIVCVIFMPPGINGIYVDLYSAFSYVIYIALPFGILSLIYKKYFKNNSHTHVTRIIIKRPVLYILGSIGVVLLSTLLINLAFGWFLNDYDVGDIVSPAATPLEMLIGYFSIAFLPAIIEEWAFRGVILKHLRSYSRFGALIISSLIFGMVHVDLPRIISATIFGLVLGVCYDQTGSIKMPFIIHFINNALSLTIAYSENNPLIQSLTGILILVMIVCGVIAIIFYSKNGFKTKAISFIKPFNCGYKVSAPRFLLISVFNVGILIFLPLFSLFFYLTYFVSV